MLSSISISNYQSLTDVNLELSPLTVIIGPSNVGKSAFTRAAKCLTSNERGDRFITHGEKQTRIQAETERGTVTLYRGKRNEYVLSSEDGTEKSYTKLSGAVPEEVSEFIGIPAVDPINYASQFDMPYLLKTSASEVARTLGELTNVSVIFEAAREANRQRAAAAAKLKTRAADYEDLTVNLDRYRTLKEDTAAVEEAEQLLASARDRQTRIFRLQSAVQTLESIPDVPAPVELPDISGVEAAAARVERMRALAHQIMTLETDEEYHRSEQQSHQSAAAEAEQLLQDELERLGVCPTCGQTTHNLQAHSS